MTWKVLLVMPQVTESIASIHFLFSPESLTSLALRPLMKTDMGIYRKSALVLRHS